MDLDTILKVCWVIIVVILTLTIIVAFIETLVKKVQEPKRKKEFNKALDTLTEEFIKGIQEELNDEKKPKPAKRTTKKTVKKKED